MVIKMVLKGKIIKILDGKRVIINLGYKQGIKKEMKFFIYSEGEEIKDPDTNQVLGKREIVKHKIKVKHIQETFSIMESDEYYITKLDLILGVPTKRQESFNLEKNIESKSEDNIIRLGDLVRQEVS